MLRVQTPKHTGRNLEVYKPGDTRFASNFRMIDRLSALKHAITFVGLSAEYHRRCVERKEDCPVQHLIVDKAFWHSVDAWKDLLMPAYMMLREVDTHEPRLHIVYESALELQVHYNKSPHPSAAACAQIWQKDWEYLHVPIHSAAHALNPRYQSDNLMDDEDVWTEFLDVCEKMLGPVDGQLAVNQYAAYASHKGMFGNAMARGAAADTETPAYEWWALYGSSAPQLKHLAMKVLSQPASASASEQSWSEYDFVHSKRRNRLKVDVARQLVYVHSNLRLLRKLRDCSRYKALVGASAEQLQASQSKVEEYLVNEGWDGNCSDDDTDAESFVSCEPNPDYLDASSIVHDCSTSEFIARGQE